MQSPNYSDPDVIDLEEHFKAGKPVPRAKRYRIKIDKEYYVVDVPEMTGRQLLTLAGKTPAETFILQQKKAKQVTRIELDEAVNFVARGIERFMTLAKEANEGEGQHLRRAYALLESDREYLDGLGLPWEAVIDNGIKRLVILDWPMPQGYTINSTSINIRLEPGYPDSEIDMAYFHPAVARANGKLIGATSTEIFDGREWQRWSRHRTVKSAWRIGIDCVATHMAFVDGWLSDELLK
jgi:Prokaryotic E2 family E/Multiubiquitin